MKYKHLCPHFLEQRSEVQRCWLSGEARIWTYICLLNTVVWKHYTLLFVFCSLHRRLERRKTQLLESEWEKRKPFIMPLTPSSTRGAGLFLDGSQVNFVWFFLGPRLEMTSDHPVASSSWQYMWQQLHHLVTQPSSRSHTQQSTPLRIGRRKVPAIQDHGAHQELKCLFNRTYVAEEMLWCEYVCGQSSCPSTSYYLCKWEDTGTRCDALTTCPWWGCIWLWKCEGRKC